MNQDVHPERAPGAPGGLRVVKVVSNNAVPYDRRVWLEATSLAAAGHRVTVVCPREPGADEPTTVLEGVEIVRYRLPIEGTSAVGLVTEFAWSFVAVAWHVLRLRRRDGAVDVLHVANPPETFWPLARLLARRGTRFVFDHHDLSPEMYVAKGGAVGGVVHRALQWLERRTFATADLVISTNESYARLAADRGAVPAERIAVVRSAPDLARWSVVPRDESVAAGRRYVVGYLGEMGEQDGIEHLLDAAARIREHRDDVQYVLVGDGPHQAALQAHATRLGLDDCTTFTGRQVGDELCRLMSSMDVGTGPDPRTDWSDKSTMNKILDYMFFGLPIVSYALTESIASAGPDAALFVAGDTPADLAAGIESLLDDPDRRAAMGAAGSRRLREQLSWSASARALEAAYDRLRTLPLRRARG